MVDSNAAFGTLADLVPRFDELLQAASPKYKYADSKVHGVSIAEVDAGEMRVTFLQIADVKNPTWDGVVTRKAFRTVAGSARVEAV